MTEGMSRPLPRKTPVDLMDSGPGAVIRSIGTHPPIDSGL
jgi:hypothetical protein